MHVIIFIIIAYALRHRFLDEDANSYEKIMYYGACAVFSPLVGPFFYKYIYKDPKPNLDEDPNDCYIDPGML